MYETLVELWKKNKKDILVLEAISFVTGLFAYYLFIIYGYGSPDGLVEGLYYYTNEDWHLACGRWAVRYLNILIGHNIVMPLIIVFIYSICITISLLILSKSWYLKSKAGLYVSAAIMMVCPSVIGQLMYPHVALTFSFAFLFASLYYAFGKANSWWLNVLAIPSLAISMGLYQSYLGAAVAFVLLGTIIAFVAQEEARPVLLGVAKFFILGVLGCLLDVAIYKTEIKIRGTEISGRVTAFSVDQIFSCLKDSVKNCYSTFFDFFTDASQGRRYWYMIFLFICLFAIAYQLVDLAKQKRFAENIVSVLALLLLPLGMNIVHVLISYNGINLLMQYQYVLLVPFGFSILEVTYPRIRYQLFRTWGYLVSNIAVILVFISYVVSANASFECLKISYNAIQVQTELILEDVYDLDGYVPNQTQICFAGFPSDSVVRNNLKIYQYAIGLSDNVAYWEDMSGIVYGRRAYLLNYCGIESGFFSNEEYYWIIDQEEFKNMPVWPAEGSVAMIGGKAVVKLTEGAVY